MKCESQFLPALTDDGEYADFICPRLLAAPGADETSVDRMWPLVQAAEQLLPPCRELAPDWTTIVDGWRSLGVTIEPLCVAKLAEWVRADDGKTLEELKVEGDAQEWLATFIDIVGECWRERTGTDLSALRGLIPNQNRRLCSPSELKREQGVPGQLKDICTGMGYDIRDQLVLGGFEGIAHSRGLRHLTEALVDAIPRSVTEDEIIADAVENMNRKLPEDQSCDDVSSNVQQATVRLLAHLWESRERAAASIARQVPLIASSGRAVRWSADRLFMAPVRAWPESAQPFAGAYPPNRVLHDLYAGSDTEIPNVSAALTQWGITLADPITDSTVELKDRRLAALSDSQELRNSLARLVETGGADPEFYAALAAEAEAKRQRSRDVERCRNLGLAVQEAIGVALERHKLSVKLVDRGFDYEVEPPSDDVIDDTVSGFEIGPYLVEVKATKTGRARLTPTQAETASRKPAQYVLCVVDLCSVPEADLERDWTADRVEPLAKLIPDIGDSVEETYECVETARKLTVSIRNDSALRYEVPPEIWECGMSIAAWVKAIKGNFS